MKAMSVSDLVLDDLSLQRLTREDGAHQRPTEIVVEVNDDVMRAARPKSRKKAIELNLRTAELSFGKGTRPPNDLIDLMGPYDTPLRIESDVPWLPREGTLGRELRTIVSTLANDETACHLATNGIIQRGTMREYDSLSRLLDTTRDDAVLDVIRRALIQASANGCDTSLEWLYVPRLVAYAKRLLDDMGPDDAIVTLASVIDPLDPLHTTIACDDRGYPIEAMLPDEGFDDLDRTRDYVARHADVRQWLKCLKAQRTAYGRVTDTWPENMMTTTVKAQRDHAMDELTSQAERNAQTATDYESSDGRWSIAAPSASELCHSYQPWRGPLLVVRDLTAPDDELPVRAYVLVRDKGCCVIDGSDDPDMLAWVARWAEGHDLHVTDMLSHSVTTTPADTTAPDEPHKKRPRFDVVLSDGIDGVLRRRTARTERLLVLLMSKGQFYLRDERTGELSGLDKLESFLNGAPPDVSPVPWLGEIPKSHVATETFKAQLETKVFRELAREGLVTSRPNDNFCGPRNYKNATKAYRRRAFPALWAVATDAAGTDAVTAFWADDSYLRDQSVAGRLMKATQVVSSPFLYDFADTFGDDAAVRLARRWLADPTATRLPRTDTSRLTGALAGQDPDKVADYALWLLEAGSNFGNPSVDTLMRTWLVAIQATGDAFPKNPSETVRLHDRETMRERARENALALEHGDEGLEVRLTGEDEATRLLGRCRDPRIRALDPGSVLAIRRAATHASEPIAIVGDDPRRGMLATTMGDDPLTDDQMRWIDGWAESRGLTMEWMS